MKFVLATPLFPPELGTSAWYTAELARRLAAHHDVTVVTYGHDPVRVSGVRIVTIDKRLPRRRRLHAFGTALAREAHGADVLFAERGAAAGLPALRTARAQKMRLVVHLPHDEAWERMRRREPYRTEDELAAPTPRWAGWYGLLLRAVQARVVRKADHVLFDSALHADILGTRFHVREARRAVVPPPSVPHPIVPFPAPHEPKRILVYAPSVLRQTFIDDLRALDRVREALPDRLLTLIGVPCSVYDQAAADAAHIECRETVSRAELAYLGASTETLVLLDDGLADVGVLTDLCALGVPIVAAATSIAAIILGTDVVVPFDSTEDGALASAVEHAVTDRTLRAAQATAAGACATTHAWDTHISAIDDIVRPAL